MRVAGIPTTDTRSKCQATSGNVAKVAETPAAMPDRTPEGILPVHPRARSVDMGFMP